MGEPIIKRCPACLEAGIPDIPLRELANKTSGHHFLGCSRFPECSHTEEIPETIRMRRAGAPVLPGFE